MEIKDESNDSSSNIIIESVDKIKEDNSNRVEKHNIDNSNNTGRDFKSKRISRRKSSRLSQSVELQEFKNIDLKEFDFDKMINMEDKNKLKTTNLDKYIDRLYSNDL